MALGKERATPRSNLENRLESCSCIHCSELTLVAVSERESDQDPGGSLPRCKC
jgi:hypothetical protein